MTSAETVYQDGQPVQKALVRAREDGEQINVYADAAALASSDAGDSQFEVYVRSLKSLFRKVTGSTEEHDGSEVIHDNEGHVWIRWPRTRWEPVAVVGNEADIDLSLNDHFEITVDDDCEIQLPSGGWTGMPFLLRIVMSGNDHAVTFAEGWEGDTPVILDQSGQQTILACCVIDTSPSVTAITNLVKHIP